MSRAERAAEAARLRSEGLTVRAVASRMGVSRSYAGALLNDPDRVKEAARRERYRLNCPRCGTLMDGSNGRGGDRPHLCLTCSPRERTVWTRAIVLGLLRSWVEHYGHPPAIYDWDVGHARSVLAAGKIRDPAKVVFMEACVEAGPGAFPSQDTVRRLFGGWKAMVRAGGFTPRYHARVVGRVGAPAERVAA